MNSIHRKFAAAAFICTAGVTSLFAQADIRGHWTGSLQGPAGSLVLEVDLDKTGDGWIGSASIPAQGANGIPLDAVSFSNGKGSFRIKDAPGDPTFTGTLSADGNTLDGEFVQGPMSAPLKFARNGEAKVVVQKPSPAVAPEFVGTWEGLIEGAGLHAVLTITNGKNGAEAVMLSPDQGNAKIPVASITQSGTKLLLLINAVAATYNGEINKAGTEITGTFTQGGNGLTLTLKKSAK